MAGTWSEIDTETGEATGPYSQRTVLDGVPLRFGFEFNGRAQTWTLSLAGDDGTTLCSGIPILAGVGLTDAYKTLPGMPQGTLIAYAKERPDEPAGEQELGDRVILLYQGTVG